MNARWDIFLSYASEDCDIAEELHDGLVLRGLTVWYDKNEMEIGDEISNRLADGLTKSQFGVPILSKAYLSKKWTLNELATITSIESLPEKKLLPVWHDIDQDYLAEHAPLLTSRVGISTFTGAPNVCEKIVKAIRAEYRRRNPPPSSESIQPQEAVANRAKIESGTSKSHAAPAYEYFPKLACDLPLPSVDVYDPQSFGRLIPTSIQIARGLAAMKRVIELLMHQHRRGNFLLVGINRGGWAIGNFLADRIGLQRIHLLRYDYLKNWEKAMIEPRPPIADIQLVVAVDDITRTGETISVVRALLAKNYPIATIYSLALNVRATLLSGTDSSGKANASAVDYSPIIANIPHPALPWNVGTTSDIYSYVPEQDIDQAEAAFG